MVENLLYRVMNMRESALLAALYIGKQLLSALYGRECALYIFSPLPFKQSESATAWEHTYCLQRNYLLQ